MTDVVPYEPPAAPRVWVELMEPAARLAEAVARTDFVPQALRGNPAAITAAILYGDEVGLAPMQSLSKVHVIDGRPALSAEAQRALILAAGHEMWLGESTNTRVTWCGRRSGSTQESRVSWTLDDAKKAGLDGRQNWRRYPRQMLSARASAELARAMFADVIGGLAAVEELEDPDIAGDDDAPTAGGTPAKSPRKAKRPGKKAAEPKVADAPKNAAPVALPALPGAEVEPGRKTEPSPADPEQQTDESDPGYEKARAQAVARMIADRGLTTDDERHDFLHAFTAGRTSSSYGITPDEMPQLRAALVRVHRGELAVTAGADGPILVDTKSGLVPTRAHDEGDTE